MSTDTKVLHEARSTPALYRQMTNDNNNGNDDDIVLRCLATKVATTRWREREREKEHGGANNDVIERGRQIGT